jgi:opacity protein-like surface antigen
MTTRMLKFPVEFVFFILLLNFSSGKAANPENWSFRFGFGAIFPDASQLVGADSPNGLNISAGMCYLLNSRMMLSVVLHFDYFSDDLRTDYRTYIVLLNPTTEVRVHPLPVQGKISPYVSGGLAPGLYLNSQPVLTEDGTVDPYSNERNYSYDVGYSIRYGLGSNFNVARDIYLWVEWQYSRFGFFSGKAPLHYRALTIGLLMNVDLNF